jgi:hypothetical protein
LLRLNEDPELVTSILSLYNNLVRRDQNGALRKLYQALKIAACVSMHIFYNMPIT